MITIYDKRDATLYKFIFHSGLKGGWGGTIGMWHGQDRDLVGWDNIIPDLVWTLKNDEAEIRSVDSSGSRQILVKILFEYPK